MLRTFGLEPTSLVISDPEAWKVPKGSRSSSRRARKTVCEGLTICTGLISKSSESANMPVSGSDKRGASMLDCRFSEKAEHVPIKKRRFLLRSPSPPPPVVSPQCIQETDNLTKSVDASHRHAVAESASSDINLSKIIDNNTSLHDKSFEKATNHFGEEEDFSGMSILAAAACSSGIEKDCGYAEDVLGVEDSSAQWRAREVSAVTDTLVSTKEILKEDHVNSSEVSTGRTSSCVSPEPVGQLASTSSNVNSSENITAAECTKDVSMKVDSLILSRDVSCSKDEERVGSQNLCSRDDRFHWDLNVMMDAWEEPFESPIEPNDVPCSLSQDDGKNSHEIKSESFDDHDFPFKPFKLATTYAMQMPGEPRKSANLRLGEKKVNNNLGKCHDVDQSICLNVKPPLSDCNKNQDVGKSMSEEAKVLCHNRIAKSNDRSVDTALDFATIPSASDSKNDDDDVPMQNLKSNSDCHHKKSSILEGLNLNSGESYCMLEKLKRACASDDTQPSLHVYSSSDVKMEVMENLAVPEIMKASEELQHNRNSVAEKGGMKTTELLEPPIVTTHAKDLSHSSCVEVPNTSSTKCNLKIASDAEEGIGNIKGEKLKCRDDSTVKVSEISVLSKVTSESVSHDTFRANLDKSSDCSEEIDVAEACSQIDCVNVGSHFLPVVGANKKVVLQDDYDSQYEDGEVREPNQLLWEGYDVVDREVEHVDYESDDMEACTLNPTGYPVSMSGQVEARDDCGPEGTAVVSSSVCSVNNDVGGETAEHIGNDGAQEEYNQLKLNPQSEEKAKSSMSKELLAGRGSSSDMDIGVSDDDGGKDRLTSHADRLVDSRISEAGIETKPFRRGLQSRIEGPVAHDTSSREERLNKMESRYEESSSMRSFERNRYSFQNQARGRPADNWDGFPDNRRPFRRHYSPITHRHSKVDDDAIMERDDIGYLDVQDDVSYSHQLHPKSRPGGNEDDCAGLPSRYKPNRTFSPGRPGAFGRGRSIRYGSFADSRGGRGRYNGPSPDDSFQSSLKYRRPFSRRERSFSPFGGRGQSNANHPRGKSPSQSRSRSPVMWNSPRGRPGAGSGGSTFIRHRSRSPNFGSEVRMQRMRYTHQQPGFGPDDEGGFRSIPRGRGSPPHGRWNAAGKEESGHFREFGYNKQRNSGLERSPGRIRMRGDRAGVFDPPRNLKPDGYYRISEDATCRGARFEENYDGRRKHYGPLRPARRSYEDGFAGRLNQDIDDSFSIPKGMRDRGASDFQGRGGRGMDNRINDVPRRFRGEQHSFMCERDGKFNSTSKQFGLDAMDSSHNMKSEEQYRSSHVGRFNDMDGVNRGRRYDNFEERRKQYPPANLMKRSDNTDGSEKRLNHNLEENFQDAPDFCGRGMRNFDGRVGGLSTRLREDKDSAGCGQEKKLEDNTQ